MAGRAVAALVQDLDLAWYRIWTAAVGSIPLSQTSYQQFCPVAMTAEILCTRWTVVLIRELIAGSCRFNDLRRGLPRMSPSLLSQRLKELETSGIVARAPCAAEPGVFEYRLTQAGEELRPIVEAFGVWGQRWIDTEVSMQHLDVQLLMWDVRRNLNPAPMPRRRCVILVQYPELSPTLARWWLVVDPETGVDLCSIDPGFDVDLYLATDLRTMTSVWMGHSTVKQALAGRSIQLTGDSALAASFETWIGLNPLAKAARAAGQA